MSSQVGVKGHGFTLLLKTTLKMGKIYETTGHQATKNNDLMRKETSKVRQYNCCRLPLGEHFLATAQRRGTQAKSGSLPEIRRHSQESGEVKVATVLRA